MKVYAISDLHLSINNPKPMDIFGGAWDDYVAKILDSWDKKVYFDDVVLLSGDISWAMTLEGALPDLKLLGGLKGRKIIIRGNHDYWWKSISAVRGALSDGLFALQNNCIRLGDYLFCGARGWSVDVDTPEDKKIYERELIRFRLALEEMKKMRAEGDKCVAMIHYPPFNYKLESSDFTNLFEEFKVDKVVYGHLHGKNVRTVKRFVKNGIEYILSSCDQVNNELVEIF